jgi:hypothetical protein
MLYPIEDAVALVIGQVVLVLAALWIVVIASVAVARAIRW